MGREYGMTLLTDLHWIPDMICITIVPAVKFGLEPNRCVSTVKARTVMNRRELVRSFLNRSNCSTSVKHEMLLSWCRNARAVIQADYYRATPDHGSTGDHSRENYSGYDGNDCHEPSYDVSWCLM
jgi:hypothetical protein